MIVRTTVTTADSEFMGFESFRCTLEELYHDILDKEALVKPCILRDPLEDKIYIIPSSEVKCITLDVVWFSESDIKVYFPDEIIIN